MSSWGQGGSRNWRKTRQEVLDRDNYECQRMLPGCLFAATEVNHKGGLGGAPRMSSCDPDDCEAVCGPCHQKITARQSVAAQRQMNAIRTARRKLPVKPHPGEMRSP